HTPRLASAPDGAAHAPECRAKTGRLGDAGRVARGPGRLRADRSSPGADPDHADSDPGHNPPVRAPAATARSHDVVVQSRAVAVRVPRSAPRATPWPSAPARRSYGTIDRRVQEQRGRLRVRPPLSERGHPLNKDELRIRSLASRLGTSAACLILRMIPTEARILNS